MKPKRQAVKRLIGMEPWSAAGPGWARSGVTLLFEDRATGKVTRDTVYSDELPIGWHAVARIAYDQLVRATCKLDEGGFRRRRGRRK